VTWTFSDVEFGLGHRVVEIRRLDGWNSSVRKRENEKLKNIPITSEGIELVPLRLLKASCPIS
jgi:hypothetical protein